MLTVPISTISISQVSLLKKNAKATHIFFSKNISVYAIFNDQSFNDTLTNDIVTFEQLDPDCVNIPSLGAHFQMSEGVFPNTAAH